ncbi:MAG TPA: GNAT family protein [Nocardioides sp.]|nr:GNAT family protein [Nocardioides sp.]
MGLRPLRMSDARAWHEVRRRNAAWLTPWEATVPPGDRSSPKTFRALVRDLRRQARQRRALPFAVTVDDELAGQVTVSNITGGSARWGQVGYWVDERHAGRGVIPTAVALVVDYCLLELDLHRIEVAIRPENTASLRVVEKLGFTEIGYAPRYLHIDGDWRDHRLFAVTAEEVGDGLLRRFRGREGPESHPSQ